MRAQINKAGNTTYGAVNSKITHPITNKIGSPYTINVITPIKIMGKKTKNKIIPTKNLKLSG
jgi:hypothetical protein